jgi:hypothetical protein
MHFVGSVRTEWLKHESEDRRMRLLEDFAFVDSLGFEWKAPAGDVVDGASVPSFLWSVVGSPFTGDYRRASVLHDVACQRKSRSSRDVHRMFYEAMVIDGVDKDTALKFYTSVRLFGPQWDVAQDGAIVAFSTVPKAAPQLDFGQVEASLDAILGI